MFYTLIWLLLQTCFTIYQHLWRLLQPVRKLQWSYDQRRDNNSNSHTDLLTDCENIYLAQCRTQLKKLPRHLSLIIGPDERFGEEVITRILDFALRVNIDCISFYDTRPNEKCRVRLNKLRQPKDIICEQLSDRHIQWKTRSTFFAPDSANGKSSDSACNGHTNTTEINRTKGHTNGFKAAKSIVIYEIKSSDGRGLISDVCRELFKRRQSDEVQQLLQNRTLLTQRIDKDLSQFLWKDKDPEICIVFAKHMCTFGMLPWHTRFTEFYLHQQEEIFDAKTFAKILFQYSRCEQRWGK